MYEGRTTCTAPTQVAKWPTGEKGLADLAYFTEFRANWRQLAAATIGMAWGYGINNYLNNIFVPPLMAEFGWQRSQIALLGMAAATSMVAQPIAGRLTDRFGVRTIASIGAFCATLIYLSLSMMTGPFVQFAVLTTLQIALGAMVGTVVYSRLIAQSFTLARGFALAIASCAPSIVGALLAPALSELIARDGWRAGYQVIAAVTAVAGAIAIAMIPRERVARLESAGISVAELRAIRANRAFWLIICGTLLCSLTVVMQTTQLKTILLDAGLGSITASWLISTYALGVVAGRLSCGIALDRFAVWKVAAFSLGLPAVGLIILASGTSSPAMMGVAVLFLGLSLGAEGDVAGVLAMTYFELRQYSTFVGIFVGTIALSSALGSLLLSLCLASTGSFAPFLLGSALVTMLGSLLFWRLRHVPAVAPLGRMESAT